MFIDTHCHLNLISSAENRLTDIIQQAAAQKVNRLITIATNYEDALRAFDYAEEFPSVFAAIGIHPNELTDSWHEDLEKVATLLQKNKHKKIVALGECGLDKHYPNYDLVQQEAAFRAHIELSIAYKLPLVIHTRDAQDQVLTILHEYRSRGIGGVIHCFSEDKKFAYHALELGFLLGIGGIITYPKNNLLRAIVKEIGLSHLVLETDAPFLPPQGLRGTRNQPANIPIIAQFIADLLETTIEDVALHTTTNAERVFSLHAIKHDMSKCSEKDEKKGKS